MFFDTVVYVHTCLISCDYDASHSTLRLVLLLCRLSLSNTLSQIR